MQPVTSRVRLWKALGLHYKRKEQKKKRAARNLLARLMLIGYARISTTDQTLALQQDALKTAGCEKVSTDTASGSRTDRPGLAEAMSSPETGDTLVVWALRPPGPLCGASH